MWPVEFKVNKKLFESMEKGRFSEFGLRRFCQEIQFIQAWKEGRPILLGSTRLETLGNNVINPSRN